MIYALLIVLAVVGGLVVCSGVYGHFKGDGKELKSKKAQLRIATGGLRKIANGISGSPELDAQNTLEDIDKQEIKEIG